MSPLATALVVLVAVLHVWFLILEMFIWTRPLGLKLMRMSQQRADDSRILALNQGLYNGFLAAGLLTGLWIEDPVAAKFFVQFFLACVIVAGIVGGASFSRRIFFIQGVPAIFALLALSF